MLVCKKSGCSNTSNWVVPQKLQAFVPLIRRDESFFYVIKKFYNVSILKNAPSLKMIASSFYGKKKGRVTMNIVEYENLKQYTEQYDMIPVTGELFSDVITPITLLRRLKETCEDCFLLESVENGERIGRYSFLGVNPKFRVYSESNEVTLCKGNESKVYKEEPLQYLKNLLKQYRSPKIKDMPTFTGGLVGYFSYEMFQLSEPTVPMKESEFHLYDFMLFDKIIVFDHLTEKIIVIVNMKAKEKEVGYQKAVDEMKRLSKIIYSDEPVKKSMVYETPKFKSNVTQEEYYNMVEKTKQHIFEGDIFQGVISRRFEAEYKSSLLNTYRVMRTINPSPYMYYIKCEDVEIAGVSPETMVKLVDGKLTTFPVAGTRKRGKTQEEDLLLEKELLADEKELAEHNMLVDLARNDIGRLSEYGSVAVEEYMQIHRFSKVMHIASVVTGQIREELDGIDTVAAMLPAGTLSGAPKIRACEIIHDVEPVSRGVYGGAIGYIDFSGNLDVCIGIRTAVKKGEKLYVQAGAGIVADSIPKNEYEECENKAKAVIESVLRASEVNEA